MKNYLKDKWEQVKGADHQGISERVFAVCRWFNIQLTTAFGIVTTVHWSVLAFGLALLLLSGQTMAWMFMIGMLSVVPHEYGHAIAGRYCGVGTRRILIYPIGGVALMEGMPKKWYQEVGVALAGPAVSLVLALVGLIGTWIEGPTQLVVVNGELGYTFDYRSIWMSLFVINTVLFVFNMIPAFPMDGGRVLRAVLQKFFGKLRATQIAFYVACGLCGLMFVGGLLMGNFGLMLVAFMVVMLARQELLQVQVQAQQNLE